METTNTIIAYKYDQLTDKAKEIAIDNVYQKECHHIPWEIYLDDMELRAKGIAKENGLSIEEIGWERRYGLEMDYRKGSLESEFFEKHLSKEQRELLEGLENVSCDYLEHRLFHPYESEKYALHFDYPGGIDDKILMEFFYKYSTDEEQEELKAQITMPHLLNSSIEDDEELYNQLYDECTTLAASLAENLGEIIASIISNVLDNIEKMIDSTYDYYESDEYAKDSLENQGAFYEDYLFTETGEICIRNDEVCEKFEDYEIIKHEQQ